MPLNNVDLKDYMSDTFVETGTWIGDGIKQALDAGFKAVHSVDIPNNPRLIPAKKRFAANKAVTIHTGDSAKVLPQLLKSIKGSITFWLDAHPPGNLSLTADGNGRRYAPVMAELNAIQAANIANKIILIDDLRIFTEEDRNTMQDKLTQMGAKSVYRVNGQVPADILVGKF